MLVPNSMWRLAEVKALHDKFHMADKPRLYLDGLSALSELPARSESSKSKVLDFLFKWGHVRGPSKTDALKMLDKLNQNADLVVILRQHSIDDDLSQKLTYATRHKPTTKTVAGWMQILLREISGIRPRQVVASTKLLHAAVPQLFVMFDNAMCRRFFATPATEAIYCGLFLPLVQAQIQLLRQVNMTPSGNPEWNDKMCCHDNWAKFVDEINWTWANRQTASLTPKQ